MARKRLNILVAGGFDPNAPKALERSPDQIIEYTRYLGGQIIKQGHNLLTGCQTELDKIVAEAADQTLVAAGCSDNDRRQRVISYVLQGQEPVHHFGTVIQSDLPDWDIGGLQPTPPEVIRNADAVILLGGFYGTFKAANWARIDRKPLLPVAIFGGAAKEVYTEEAKRFEQVYASNITRLEYEQVLKSLSTNWDDFASQTVNLVEKVVTSPSVFVIMSFKDLGHYKDLYASIKRVCEKYDYEARRVDESNISKRIIPEITRQVRHCAFVIADVTEERPNVYYELGFADGVGKEVILVAKAETKVPFDINDVPILFWDSFSDFEAELTKRVERIGTWQGHA
jgi:predicted Rossmann-fold nucleotide-binding protein